MFAKVETSSSHGLLLVMPCILCSLACNPDMSFFWLVRDTNTSYLSCVTKSDISADSCQEFKPHDDIHTPQSLECCKRVQGSLPGITNPLRLFRLLAQKPLPFWPRPIFLGQARRVMAAQREIRKEASCEGKPVEWTCGDGIVKLKIFAA